MSASDTINLVIGYIIWHSFICITFSIYLASGKFYHLSFFHVTAYFDMLLSGVGVLLFISSPSYNVCSVQPHIIPI